MEKLEQRRLTASFVASLGVGSVIEPTAYLVHDLNNDNKLDLVVKHEVTYFNDVGNLASDGSRISILMSGTNELQTILRSNLPNEPLQVFSSADGVIGFNGEHGTSDIGTLTDDGFRLAGNGAWDNECLAQIGSIQLTIEDNTLSVESVDQAMADFDTDGEVGFGDFLVLSENFGGSVKPFTQGDMTGDGSVQFDDFLSFSRIF